MTFLEEHSAGSQDGDTHSLMVVRCYCATLQQICLCYKPNSNTVTQCAKCIDRAALNVCLLSLSALTRHPERGASSNNQHKEMQQLLHVQRRDHAPDAVRRIHGGKSGCVSGQTHLLNATLHFKESPFLVWFVWRE